MKASVIRFHNLYFAYLVYDDSKKTFLYTQIFFWISGTNTPEHEILNEIMTVRDIAENNSVVEFDNSGVVEFRSAVEFDSAFTSENTKIKNSVPKRLKWKLFEVENHL